MTNFSFNFYMHLEHNKTLIRILTKTIIIIYAKKSLKLLMKYTDFFSFLPNYEKLNSYGSSKLTFYFLLIKGTILFRINFYGNSCSSVIFEPYYILGGNFSYKNIYKRLSFKIDFYPIKFP